jgi:hypothetical protein
VGCELHVAVRRDQLPAEFREPRATASGAADARCADGLFQNVIEVIEEQPGAPVAHPKLARCL